MRTFTVFFFSFLIKLFNLMGIILRQILQRVFVHRHAGGRAHGERRQFAT